MPIDLLNDDDCGLWLLIYPPLARLPHVVYLPEIEQHTIDATAICSCIPHISCHGVTVHTALTVDVVGLDPITAN